MVDMGAFSPLTQANLNMLRTLIPMGTAAQDTGVNMGVGVPASQNTAAVQGPRVGSGYQYTGDQSGTPNNGDWISNILNQPITKGILNILGTGAYTVGDAIDSLHEDIQNGVNPLQTIADSTVGAIGRGISGGFGQNPNDEVMPSKALYEAGALNPNDNPVRNTVIGTALDMGLDPLSYVGGGPVADIAKGAVRGASEARLAAQTAKAGGDVVGETSALKGAFQGAKQGYSDYKQGLQDAKSVKDTAEAAQSQGANTAYEETVPGIKFMPDKVDNGETAAMTANDMATVGKNEAVARNLAATPVGTDNAAIFAAPTDPENAAMMAKFAETAGDIPPELKAADIQASKTTPLPPEKTIGESIQTERAGSGDIPDAFAPVSPDKVVDSKPPLVKASDYSHYTPADRFVSGTEHLVGQEPKYSDLQTKQLNDYFGRPAESVTHTDWQGLSDDIKNTPVGVVYKNGYKTLSPRAIAKDIDSSLKTQGDAAIPELEKKYFSYIPKYMKDAYTVTDVAGGLPTVEEATQLGLDPSDFTKALAEGGVNGITQPTGNLSRIFDNMTNGLLPENDVARFQGFMRNFTENPDLDLPGSIQAAKDFVENNREAVLKSSQTLRDTADGGRLALLKNAGENPAVNLSRLIDAGTADAYRIPFTPEKSAQVLDAQSALADHAIKSGLNADFVGQLADDVLKSTFKVQEDLAKTPEGLINGPVKWTTASAIHPYTAISQKVSDFLFGSGIRGRTFAHMKDDMVMRALGKVDAEMKKMGVFPYLTNVMPKDGPAIRASVFDVLASMTDSDRIHFLGYGRPMNAAHLLPTQIMDGAETMLRTVIDSGALHKATTRPEFLDALKGKFSDKDIEREISLNLDQKTQAWNTKLAERVIDESKFLKNRDEQYRKLYGALENALPELAERVLRNNALHGELMSNRIEAISQDTADKLKAVFETGQASDAVEEVAKLGKPIRSETEPEAAQLANQATQEVKNQFATPMEQIHADQSAKISNVANKQKNVEKPSIASRKMEAATQQDINKMNAELHKRTGDPMTNPDNLSEAMEGGPDALYNVFRNDEAAAVAKRHFPFQRIFNAQFGKWGNYAEMTSGVHAFTASKGTLEQALNELNASFPREELKRAFFNLQAGEERATPAMQAMGKIMDALFDEGDKNLFSRNGVSAEHLNEIMDAGKAPSEWRFESKIPTKMAQEWKGWTVEDPLRFINGMFQTQQKALLDIHRGAVFSSGGKASISAADIADAAANGGKWMKIDPKTIGNNRLAKLIDKDLYYPSEVLQTLPHWNMVMTDSRSFKGMFGEVMDKIVDPMVNSLKLTNTVVKPGHHLMALIGNILTNSATANVGLKQYAQNVRIMASRRQLLNELSGAEDFARVYTNATKGVHLRGVDDGSNSVRFTNIIGKGPINLRNEDLFSLMENKNAYYPRNHGGAAEDYLRPESTLNQDSKLGPILGKVADAAQGTNKGLTKLLNNRVVKMNEFTSERENLTRGALFIKAMQSKPFHNFGEAADFAASEMRRVYPTAQDFTAAESKYVRRLFFYYTWQRGILPVVAEAMVRHPAWALAPAKMSYDMAEANGVHPDSLGDPFPQDQMFPAYYKDMVLGPQWKTDDGHYWGFNPTSPVLDTLNSLGAGVSLKNLFMNPFDPKSGESQLGRTFLGMTNPFIKTPMDLISGTNVGTGVPIKDQAEYLQDQIGPLRTISEATGKDLISTDGPGANRTGTQYQKGFATPQDWWNNAEHVGTNYLTGLQFKDFTSAAAQKSAQYDLTHNNPNKPSNTRQAQQNAARGGLFNGGIK